MEDTESLKQDLRRKTDKSSKVNRIVSLFEISRPNKHRGLVRTNSLPTTRRQDSSSSREEDKNTHTKSLFSGLYSQSGRVKKIKEEIEQKTRTEGEQNTLSSSKKKSRSKRRKCDSEGTLDSVLEKDRKKIMEDLQKINNRLGKIEIVTEDIERSDTELEITLNGMSENNDDVFEGTEECQAESSLRDKTIKESKMDFGESRLSSDTSGSGISSYTLVGHQEMSDSYMRDDYRYYDTGSGVILFPSNTSGEHELSDKHSQEDYTEEDDEDPNLDQRSLDNDEAENEAVGHTSPFWTNNSKQDEINDDNEKDEEVKYEEVGSEDIIPFWIKNIQKNKEQDDESKEKAEEESLEIIDDTSTEVDSISWWKHKSFVHTSKDSVSKTDDSSNDVERENEENTNESSTSKEKRGRMFIKNTSGRLSQRRNRRRTGVLLKSQTVKELAKQFEGGFKDAAEKGQTESYRRSFIDDMDRELANMKKDGFEDDFHLSFENLTMLDYDETLDEMIKNSDEEPTSVFQKILFFSNHADDDQELENINSSSDDDPFGETLFSEDLEHGLYYVESYNADGKELIMCSVQINRQSVDLNQLDEVKTQSESKLLAQQDDEKTLILMGVPGASTRRSSLNDSNNGTDSKRTTIYSTTSGESYDERVTDDEGIYTEKSSESYGYSAARRETYCDDQGIVRIERIAPYPENVEEHAEYMNTTNHYYTVEDPKDEDEENYYDSIRLEHEITFAVPEVKKDTLQFIVEEIKATERKYVADMKRVLQEYKPFLEDRCPDKVEAVFGNMDRIYLKQIEFLEELDNSDDDIKEVVQAFIDFEDLFRLYPRYFKNTPKSNIAVKDLAEIIKEKQEQLNDKLHLSAYLLTPLQRLGKYKLFLENITKQLKKEEKPTGSVQMALEIIKKYMSRGNDAVAVASILHSPLHYREYGSFITREKFMLIKPKRMELMVFLFQEVVVFTFEDQKNMEQFIYWKSIKTNDLRIATFEDTTLHLTDYTKTKRRYTTKHTFILDAKTEKLKNAWKQQIEEILWKQLKKVKENTIKEYQSGKKVPNSPSRNRVKSTEDDFAFSRNSIQCCPFDLNGYGSFILMDEFTVRKPKKTVMMVFLYEKIIILTKKQPNEESYYYIGSIKMDQLGLLPVNKNKKLLAIKDHVNSTKFHKDIIFKLEAASEYTQMEWRRCIEKCLWSQLLKAREKSLPQT